MNDVAHPNPLIGSFPEVIDSSMLASFKACPALFNLVFIQQWKGKDENVHLHAGRSFAKGREGARTEFYVKGLSSEDAIAEGLQALLTEYGTFQCPADSAKSAERTAGAYEFYFENYGLNHQDAYPILLPGQKRAIEFSFANPLPISHPVTGHPLLYCGRLDAILKYGETILLCDEKTTSSLGPTWSRQWDLRGQFTGYAWGCREAEVKVDGAIIRGVSILKTKFETQQAVTYRPDWQIDRWYSETLKWIEEMIRCWRAGEWRHNFDSACSAYGGCAFRLACSSQEELPWLEMGHERRYWNPVSREETPL